MSVNIGASPIVRAYLGTSNVMKICLGDTQVWPMKLNYVNNFDSADLSMFSHLQLTNPYTGPAYVSGGILYPPMPPTTNDRDAQYVLQYNEPALTDHQSVQVKIKEDAEATINYVGVSVRGELGSKNMVIALASWWAGTCGIWTIINGTFTRRVTTPTSAFTDPDDTMILQAVGNTYTLRKITALGSISTVATWVDTDNVYPRSSARRYGGVLLSSVRSSGYIANGPRVDDFNFYDLEVVPSISTISPNKGYFGGGTTVLIEGTNFVDNVQVMFGSTPGTSLNVLSPSQLSVVAPAGSIGTVPVTVVTDNGTSNAVTFSYDTGLAYVEDFNATTTGWTDFTSGSLTYARTESSRAGMYSQGMGGAVTLGYGVYNKAAATSDVYMTVTLANPIYGTLDTGSSGQALYLRIRSSATWASGTCVEAMIRANGAISLSSFNGTSVTSRATGTGTFSAGQRITLKAVGNVYTLRNETTGIDMLTWTDSGNVVSTANNRCGMSQGTNYPFFQRQYVSYAIDKLEYGDV